MSTQEEADWKPGESCCEHCGATGGEHIDIPDTFFSKEQGWTTVGSYPCPARRQPITVDWDAMTTEEVLAALRSAPKIAGAWAEDTAFNLWRRRVEGIGDYDILATFVEENLGAIYATICEDDVAIAHASIDEAKAAVDAELIRRGWRLL